jgi:hypothetical protein
VRYKPFLSHKRERAGSVAYLKEQLCVRGAGGWKDTDNIPKGAPFRAELAKAIENDTGGFIWWATKDTLESRDICELELPTALDRTRTDPSYPVIPVFVELSPNRDRDAVEAAIGSEYADQLLSANGVMRAPRQPLRELAREAARQYAKQLVKSVPAGPVEGTITAFRAPTEAHDLTLDWRTMFDADSRTLATGAIETFVEALGDIREALQSRGRTPDVSVELNLPLPLAMLVGYEWRTTTQLQLMVKTVNPDGSVLVIEPTTAAKPCESLVPRSAELPGTGPFVLALSVGADLGATVDRYAAEHTSRGFEHIHVSLDADELLDADAVRSLALHVVARMNQLQAEGTPKHLLLRTPAAVATAIGRAANATGPTWVPFYDGHDDYVGGLWIG